MFESDVLPLSAEAFLAWEDAELERHELVAGEPFAMAGASVAHGTIVANLTVAIRPALRGGPCRYFATDMKLAVPSAERRITYPDAFVTCDERVRSERTVQRFATLIVEVLSAGSAADDRGEKFADYRTIPTFVEYVMVDSRRRHVEVYRRTERATWELVRDVADGAVELAALGGLALLLDDVYADVAFEPGPVRSPATA